MWHLFDGSSDIGVVVAARNKHAWGAENLQKLEALQQEAKVELVTLEAGHNVHVDDLPGLFHLENQ